MKDQKPQSKKISVSIGGATYHLVSHENEDYMKAIASQANAIVTSIAAGNPSLSNMQTYILAIINLLDALSRKSEEYDKFKAEFDVLSVREADSAKELFANRDLNFELKKEIVRVSELNRQLMLEISSLRSQSAKEAAQAGGIPQTETTLQAVDDLPAEEELTARDEYFKDDDAVENAEFARIDELIEYEYASDLKTDFPSDADAPPVPAELLESKEDPARYGEFTQPSLDEYFPSSR
ncbi:MAG: cell division protein ZapA [Saccharofermentanales bacterium]